MTAFPGHAGRLWPLLRWRSVARIDERVQCGVVIAFPGHAGRLWPLLRWRSVARIDERLQR